MAQRQALLAGATGLVGGQVLQQLLESPQYSGVTCVVRRPLRVHHPKLTVVQAEFAALDTLRPFPAVQDVFITLGTTIKTAGSQEAFRKVDHDAVLAVAREAHLAGAGQILLVTALGANPKSALFYNRVKGEVELAVMGLGYGCVQVFRPSLLDGERTEARPGEKLGLALARLAGPLLGKRRSIPAGTVARAMVNAALQGLKGIHIHENDVLFKLAG